MSKPVEIGYLCHKGHFQFRNDPEGDSCRTKKIGTIYVKPIKGAYMDMFKEALAESIEGLHQKIEVWRRS